MRLQTDTLVEELNSNELKLKDTKMAPLIKDICGRNLRPLTKYLLLEDIIRMFP